MKQTKIKKVNLIPVKKTTSAYAIDQEYDILEKKVAQTAREYWSVHDSEEESETEKLEKKVLSLPKYSKKKQPYPLNSMPSL